MKKLLCTLLACIMLFSLAACWDISSLIEEELTADAVKESGRGSYVIQKDDAKFMITVDTDSGFGDFDDYYGLNLSKMQ